MQLNEICPDAVDPDLSESVEFIYDMYTKKVDAYEAKVYFNQAMAGLRKSVSTDDRNTIDTIVNNFNRLVAV